MLRDFICSDVERPRCAVTMTTRRDAGQKKKLKICCCYNPGEKPSQSIGAARTVIFAILGSVFEERCFNDAQQNYTCSLSTPAIKPAKVLGPLKLRLLSEDLH